MGTVRANGLDLYVNHFRSHGEGERPVVVCVHGLAVVDNAATSFVLGLHLARHADVYAYDLRGHGRSDRPPTGYHAADHAEDLVALIDALGVDRPVHVIGFSYGGAIVMTAALKAPEKFASVTLLDGHVPVEGWEDALFGSVDTFERWEDEARAKGLDDAAIEAVIIHQVMEKFGLKRRRATGVTRRVRALFSSTTLREDMRTEVTYGKEDYSRISCPVLGIYGDESDLYWLVDRLPELVPDLTLHTIHRADHLGVFWRLEETRPLISRFIGLPTD